MLFFSLLILVLGYFWSKWENFTDCSTLCQAERKSNNNLNGEFILSCNNECYRKQQNIYNYIIQLENDVGKKAESLDFNNIKQSKLKFADIDNNVGISHKASTSCDNNHNLHSQQSKVLASPKAAGGVGIKNIFVKKI